MKILTAASPGFISGTTTSRRDLSMLAPSTQAASSNSTGTESMKFLVIQMAMGREDAARKNMVPVIESRRWSMTKRE